MHHNWASSCEPKQTQGITSEPKQTQANPSELKQTEANPPNPRDVVLELNPSNPTKPNQIEANLRKRKQSYAYAVLWGARVCSDKK